MVRDLHSLRRVSSRPRKRSTWKTSNFAEKLGYLRSKPDPPGRLPGSAAAREGVAAAALTLRWGSYVAVLLDRDKPVWPAALSDGRSRISDEEMAPINIESSAALAEWIELRRAAGGGGLYGRLVDSPSRHELLG